MVDKGRAILPLGRLGLALVLLLALAGCSLFDGKEKTERLTGERLSVLQIEQTVKPDPQVADLTVTLPRPQVNPAWPQPGGYANHAMHHLTVSDDPKEIWESSVGAGSGSSRRLLVQPVVADGKIFTMDAEAEVRAFKTKNGKRIWRFDPLPDDEDDGGLGGGLAYAGGRLFVTTGAGEILALDAATGKEIWRQKIGTPMRSGPTVSNGRVFAVTVDNELHALQAATGKKLWAHRGIAEKAAILGGASPAVDRGIVIVPHSSGELFALRAENGRVLWSDGLASVRHVNAAATLTNIRGHPVIDGDRVFAVSHSGRMAAIDLRTGGRVWDLNIGAIQTPWVAGKFIYQLTNDGLLICLLRDSGRVRWTLTLRKYVDKKALKKPIVWVGPVLASDRLIVAGSHGEALAVSPYTGKVLGWMPLSEGVLIAPVVANGTLYLLNRDGDLTAMR